jgi:S1-C subfamily serine protease
VDGQATPTAPDLTAAVQACKPGTTVEIEVVRGGEIVVVKQLLEATRP